MDTYEQNTDIFMDRIYGSHHALTCSVTFPEMDIGGPLLPKRQEGHRGPGWSGTF